MWSSVGRTVTLGALPVLWACGELKVWTLVGLLLAFGAFSVFAFAATQSLLPHLVARGCLVRANAQLDQSDAAAQTRGPALGGGLVGLLGAPAGDRTRAVYPMAWILVAAAPDVPAGATLLSVALVLHGLAMGVENANDTGYWQFVTPDRLLGRANATRRSANRSAGALGAVLGGIALTVFDERLTLVGVVAVFTVSLAIVSLSPVRTLRVT